MNEVLQGLSAMLAQLALFPGLHQTPVIPPAISFCKCKGSCQLSAVSYQLKAVAYALKADSNSGGLVWVRFVFLRSPQLLAVSYSAIDLFFRLEAS